MTQNTKTFSCTARQLLSISGCCAPKTYTHVHNIHKCCGQTTHTTQIPFGATHHPLLSDVCTSNINKQQHQTHTTQSHHTPQHNSNTHTKPHTHHTHTHTQSHNQTITKLVGLHSSSVGGRGPGRHQAGGQHPQTGARGTSAARSKNLQACLLSW